MSEPIFKSVWDELRKGTVDGAGNVPSVPGAGNRVQPSHAGGAGRSEALSTPGGDNGPTRGQVQRPGSAYGNVDPEASASHGPGSLVAAALARGQSNIARYPNHTVAGALNEAAIRHNVTLYGHAGGPDAAPEESFQGTLVGAMDGDPAVFAEFQQAVTQMARAFRASTGRNPVWGAPNDSADVAWLQAYAALRRKYWGDDSADVAGNPEGA